MKIAVSGCGIAGTAVGHLLSAAGHEVTVFEQAEACRAVGAGIMLQPSGQRILSRLGIKDAIAACSAPLVGMEARLASGKQLLRLDYASLDDSSQAWGVHRGELFEQLLTLCQSSGAKVETSSQIAHYSIDGQQVTVKTESGQESSGFDFLIATDGSRSTLRDAAGIPCKTVEYPYAAIWTTGLCDAVDDRLFQVVDGTKRLVGLLPIGSGRCSFFWGLRGDSYDRLQAGGIEAWKSEVIQLCPQTESLLDSIESFDQLTFAAYRHVRLRRWHSDRIVFLGDACHASSPHLGQGVNLALEDAVVFADALGQTNDFASACQRFESLRWRKIRYYQQLTRLLTPFFQSDGQLLGFGRDFVLPWFPKVRPIRHQMLRTLGGTQSGWVR